MKWAVVVALVALAGCQSKSINEMSYAEVQEYAAELQQRCAAQGVKDNRQMQDCVLQEARSDEAKRQNSIRTRQAIGMAMAGMGQNMQRNAVMNRPVTCTSTGGYGTVRTTCY